MLILPQIIKTKWNAKHKKYYESKGYVYTKMGDEFEVDVLDLSSTSQIAVKATCDYCGKELIVSYFRANLNMKVSCKHCRPKRTLEEYGYSSNWQLEGTKQSIKNTFLEKYGVDHNFKVKKVQEKRKQTFIERYGVDNPTKSEEIKERVKQTNLERYGVEVATQSKEIQERIKQTNLEKYGVENQFQRKDVIEDISKKRIETYYKNGTGPSSQQQRHLCDLFNGELNYPVDRLMLDIAFPEEQIYVEYDGGGHDLPVKLGQMTKKEFDYKEVKRRKFLEVRGWKLIRIVCSNDKLIEDNLLIDIFNKSKKLLSSNNRVEVNLDSNEIKSYDFCEKI